MDVLASMKVRLAILSLAVGMIVHIISFSSPYWFAGEGLHGGLWLLCQDDVRCVNAAEQERLPGVFHFVQAAETIALILGLLSFGAVLWLGCSLSVHKVSICKWLSWTAGFFTLIGVITFLGKIADDKAWAAYLEFPAGLFMVAAGFFFWHEGRTSSSEYQPMS